jgi:quercetin dioxygenase-like cupin family protein
MVFPWPGKRHDRVITVNPRTVELSDSWQEEDDTARWRSGSGHLPSAGAAGSGSSLLEVDPGHRLPRHTDSAEEIVVVLAGTAEVHLGDERAKIPAGGLALIPKCVPHEVRNASDEVLRFAAVYAEPDVVTRYEKEVQPDGSAERHTVS